MQTLDEIYDAAWFAHDFEHLQPEFNIVADAIYRQFRPDMVVDVGCGPGMLLRRFKELRCDVEGIEGSSHGIAYAGDMGMWIKQADITQVKRLEHYPTRRRVVVCTEVAEHLDAVHAEGLVALLCSAMCPIVFTAAPPGQDGHHHVNLQPPSYWHELFEARGVTLDEDATMNLRDRWCRLKRLSHMTLNVQVYT